MTSQEAAFEVSDYVYDCAKRYSVDLHAEREALADIAWEAMRPVKWGRPIEHGIAKANELLRPYREAWEATRVA